MIEQKSMKSAWRRTSKKAHVTRYSFLYSVVCRMTLEFLYFFTCLYLDSLWAHRYKRSIRSDSSSVDW